MSNRYDAPPVTRPRHPVARPVNRTTRDDLRTAVHAAGGKKAERIVVLDLRGIASFTDYFVICSGTSARQVQAIADEIVEKLKAEGTRPLHIEGYAVATWILIDYGDLVVHVFEQQAREFYDLERLWRDAPMVPVEGTIGNDDR
jgi:ribosome-associated protein